METVGGMTFEDVEVEGQPEDWVRFAGADEYTRTQDMLTTK